MSSVAIKINGEFIDIDDSSAIGFTFQSYNPAEPENLFLSYTNTFSVPLTKKNKKIFQFSDNVYYNGKEVYEKFSVAVYIGASLLFSGRLFVDSIEDDRINLSIVDKLDFVESLKAIPFGVDNDEEDCLQKMIVENVNENNTFSTYDSLIQYLASGSNTLWLPYSLGRMSETFLNKHNTVSYTGYLDATMQTDTSTIQNDYEQSVGYYKDVNGTKITSFDDDKNICLHQFINSMNSGGMKTGHLFCKVSDILTLIFNKLNIESNLSTFVTNQYIRLCDIVPKKIHTTLTDYYEFEYNLDGYTCGDSDFQTINEGKLSLYRKKYTGKGLFGQAKFDYAGTEATKSHNVYVGSNYMSELTAWDLIKMLIQEYNLVVDVSWNVTTAKYVYTFEKFSNVTSATVEIYKLQSIVSKSFAIDSIKQQCVINYNEIGSEEDNTAGGFIVTCANKNVEEGSETDTLFSINRYLPSYYATQDDTTLTNYMQLDLSSEDAMQSLVMITPDTTTYVNCNVWISYIGVSWYDRYDYDNNPTQEDNVPMWSWYGTSRDYPYPVVYNVPLLVAKQTTVKVNGAYEQYQKMVEYPLVYKIKVNANVYKAISHKSNHYCKIEGLVGLYYISSIENFNPATDDYFTMTIYRLQRDEIDGEEKVFYLATEYKTFVNTEDNNYITLE